MSKNIVQLNEVGMKDLNLVGDKNASLGEMIKNLTKLGVSIPGGFVITVNAYEEFIHYNDLDEKIRRVPAACYRIQNSWSVQGKLGGYLVPAVEVFGSDPGSKQIRVDDALVSNCRSSMWKIRPLN
jgi:hypothetical protein